MGLSLRIGAGWFSDGTGKQSVAFARPCAQLSAFGCLRSFAAAAVSHRRCWERRDAAAAAGMGFAPCTVQRAWRHGALALGDFLGVAAEHLGLGVGVGGCLCRPQILS